MEHLKIAYYLAILLVGAGAIAYALFMRRTSRLPFLAPFAGFLVFNNVLALVNLTSAYACANLLGFCASFGYVTFAKVLGPAARLSQVGILYALIAAVQGFRGKRLSRSFNRAFGLAGGLLLVSYVVWAVLPAGHSLRSWIARIHLAVFGLGVLAMLGVLARLVSYARTIPAPAERRAVRVFGVSYFAVYALFVITYPLPVAVQFFPNALALLAINLIPLLWFGRYFRPAFAPPPASAGDREAVERFCRARGLTSRECDIVELILQGKSNADMEKALYISIHTVKNHITNIHAKLGVRSRWQLISLFRAEPLQPAAGLASETTKQPQNGLRPI